MSSTFLNNLLSKGALRALRHRNFVIVEAAGWLTGAGVWLYRIGIGVLAWELTESGFWLGVIAVAEAGPGIFIAPIAGALADRHDRLVLARMVQLFIMLVTSLLAALTLAGMVDIWTLVALTTLHGFGAGFWMPVRMSIAPNLVPREDLSAAITLHSTLFNIGRFLGPAIGAPILAVWGTGGVFTAIAGSYLIFLVALFAVKLVNPDGRAAAGRSMIIHLKEGLAFAARHPAIKYLFLNMLFASILLRAYMDLLPGLSETLFGYDPKVGVAILVSAAGLGAIVASILVGSVTRMTTLLRVYFFCVAGSLLCLTLFVSTSNFWFAVGCAVLLSLSQSGVNVAGQVIVQTTVQGELRGRVMSLWGLLNRSGPAIGAFVLGGLSGYAGFRWPMLAGVGISTVIAIFVFTKQEPIRQILVESEAARH
ncbi:MFS transporter [Alphaproteobacteria bacterium]|nr:MFS transporter [Alphaproteobacteria bacterium]